MKIALLISGYLRTFKLNITNIKEQILDKNDNVDIYIHITKNNDDDNYLNSGNDYDDIKIINDTLKPICILYEPNINISDNKKINDISNLWLKYKKLNDVKLSNEKIFGKYDIVIKYRPDIQLISPIDFFDLKEDFIYIPKDSKIDKNKLSNPNDNYICDIFAYGNSEIMDKYFSLYENLNFYLEKYGNVSETILYNYLNDCKINYELLDINYVVILSTCNIFAIAGDSGSGKTTLANELKKYFSKSLMLECDRYHKWERHSENWKHLTHLNPESNFLVKMNEDIFDLKIGKDIYQVDYDHKNGKFTEKEHIESSENVIVCGLHGLYTNNDNLYNLKIFIDTDKKLKDKWKIQRDVFERGHNIDYVNEQIKKREKDYWGYIHPQREKSDIIINFFNGDNEEIYLKIFINKKHYIMELLTNLSKKGVKFDLDSDNDFNHILFKKYINTDIMSNFEIKIDNYYEYIIYFILGIGIK
jgi:uridine kinase